MCGIVGYVGQSGAIDEAQLVAMRDAVLHRGPDAAGVWCSPDRSVLLGHRRLSILDLSPAGAQPMATDDGMQVIVFNGEIYNHEELRQDLVKSGVRFKGRSDTEVLLAAYRAWGAKCLSRLRGMFAFAIYDAGSRTVFLARDRAGEKPLYWARHRGGLVFVSELKSLMSDPSFRPRLSPDGLALYLAYGYVPGDHCILQGVQKLRPGHCLTWSMDSQTVWESRYWEIPAPEPADVAERSALVSELHALVSSSVREQLVADVPVAVLLSGGVDSSLVTAIAASVSEKPVQTFTVSLPGVPKFDESSYARSVAEYFGTNHVELALDSLSLDSMRALARQYDEPIADSSMIPTYLLAKKVSQYCKVVLGGDGGDELFGGYRSYQGGLRQDRLRRRIPSMIRHVLSWGARTFLPIGADGRNGLIGLGGALADGIARSGVFLDLNESTRLCPWLARERTIDPISWRRSLVEPERALPGAAMAADFRTYLPEDILTKVDRASMLCSLEVRAPLLDHRIIEFAYRRVPNALRATCAERKILLKDLARRLLPPQLDLERKQGFSIPLASWLNRDMVALWAEECREQIAALLLPKKIPWNLSSAGGSASHQLFSLMMLTWWMRHYQVAL